MLDVQQLSKRYGEQHALDDVSFSLRPGEIVALLGANGSGKTTTINAICRLLEWDSGDILINQLSTQTSTGFLRHVGAVLGGSRNCNWRLTAKQNAEYFARLRGFSGPTVRATIDRLHTQLGLDVHGNKEVMKLSTGNKQKAALLCALSYQPDYVLLDEPTLGLDFSTVEELKNIILQQAKVKQQAFLITSHDLGFIDTLCDRVLVLEHGRLIFDGDIHALKSRLFNYQLTLSGDSLPEQKIFESLWQGRFELNFCDNEIQVLFEQPEQSFATAAYLYEKQLVVHDYQVQPLSIEQAYQALVREQRG
ncbi:ABC transporter ATP-binding protein [Alteromonas flava]|uniref:ABC transporter ATP-binding protein n=1 Tax=Alteromonas flava TaxID=2048003 RepID=UPI000C2850A3|nr:ABC transporter ATP-binding protein [Alteromonas flava]